VQLQNYIAKMYKQFPLEVRKTRERTLEERNIKEEVEPKSEPEVETEDSSDDDVETVVLSLPRSLGLSFHTSIGLSERVAEDPDVDVVGVDEEPSNAN